MKKLIYGIMGLMAFGLVACDDDNLPNPAPPVNGQDAILQNIILENLLNHEEYDLTALNADDQTILVASIEPGLPDGYTYAANAQISINDFETYTSVPVRVEASDVTLDGEASPEVYYVYMNPDDLQGAVYSGISKTGQPVNIELRLQVMTVKGNQTAYVGNPEDDQNFYGPFPMYVIPYEVNLVIEENYYLIGSMEGWSLADAIKFNHDGDDQYANPIFTLEVEITESQASSLADDGWWWKIIPQSTFASQSWSDTVIGVAEDGSTDIDGYLVDSNAGSGRMAKAGTYILTINMEEMRYNFAPVVKSIYMPGGANGWGFSTMIPLVDEAKDTYAGYGAVDADGFKFTVQPNWDGLNYGEGAEAGTLSTEGGNIHVETPGMYYFDVDMTALTYTTTQIEKVGVIGDATPGGWDTDTELTSNPEGTEWRGLVNFKAGGFKFRMNNSWDLNLGGFYLNLTQNGDNLNSPGEGMYEVILYLGSYPYHCRVVAQ